MEITKKELEEVIRWANQWAEYVDYDDIIKFWKEGKSLVNLVNKNYFSLTNVWEKYKNEE